MVKVLTKKHKLVVFMLGFAGQLCWAIENQHFNLFMYNEISPKPIYVSLLVAFSAVASTLTAIFIGALSDAKGKRKIFFIIGFLFWPITTAIFPLSAFLEPVWLAATFAIIFDCIMTFFGAMATDAALGAYSADITTKKNRGLISGILELVTLLATLIIYGLSGIIIDAYGYYVLFYVVSGFVLLIGLPAAIIAPESEGLHPSETSTWENIKSTFNVETLKSNMNLLYILIAIGCWGIGFNVYFPFVMIYLTEYIKLDILQSSLLMFIALFSSIIAAIPMGKLSDKIGRKKLAIYAVLFESISLILFALSDSFIFLTLFGTFWVMAFMIWSVASKTWMKDLFPEDRRGQYSGYFILFGVLFGMVIGPLIGGFVATKFGLKVIEDGVEKIIPTNLIFIVGGILILLTLIPLSKAKESLQTSDSE